MDLKKVIEELKSKSKKRNFVQTVDLIINLKNFDPKKEKVNFYLELPHELGKEKNIALILEKENAELKEICDVLVWKQLEALDLKEFKKKIEKNYDYFITTPKIVPLLAKKFGKILGPKKKMPDPKLGSIISELNKQKLEKLIKKLNHVIKINNDGNSIKLIIGKEDVDYKKLDENFKFVYSKLIENLPKKENNIKNIFIKFTMSKPIKIK